MGIFFFLLLLYILIVLCIIGDARIQGSVTTERSDEHFELYQGNNGAIYRENVVVTSLKPYTRFQSQSVREGERERGD